MTQSFEYQKHPFDHQMILITFRVKGTHLFTCNHGSVPPAEIPRAQAQYKKLLPRTGEWLLDGPAPESVSTYHPLLVDPVTGTTKICRYASSPLQLGVTPWCS